MTFIDVGANKGDFTLLAARLTGSSGKVISIEPEPENHSMLQRSIALNAYANIKVLQLALSDATASPSCRSVRPAARILCRRNSTALARLRSRPGRSMESSRISDWPPSI